MITPKSSDDYVAERIPNHMIPQSDSTAPARQMLLDQKKIQDATAAFLQYTPSLAYFVVSLVYGPMIFMVRESAVRSVWIAFSVQLIVVGVVFGFRALSALRTRNAYEMVVLRRPSDPLPTDEMIWADRLAEGRQITQHNLSFRIGELLVWLIFAAAVYFVGRP
jgi:hypothetical protein